MTRWVAASPWRIWRIWRISRICRVAVAAVAAVAVATLAGCTSDIGTSTPVPPPAATSAATPTTASGPSGSASAPTSSAGGGGSQQAASCSPSGTSLQVSAQNVAFDKKCLAAPANKAFTITFDNKDSGVPHNVDIFTNSSATKSLFKGAIVTGPKTTTYHVPALPAGTYFFRCDIHPTQMTGTFVVS
jgi:plastocyanin